MTTQSRSLNKKSFYGAGESGQKPDIEMPPLDQTPTIAQAAPNPWDNQQEQTNVQQNTHFPVPDELPEEVEQAMAESVADNTETTEDNLSTVQQESDRDETSRPQKQDHPNFKAIREAKERAEYERDLLLKQMYELQAQMQQQQKPQPQEEEPLDFDIDEDALVEGKHVKKVMKQFKKMEQSLKQQQEMNAAALLEAKIKADFPDINEVVTQQNVERLNTEYPEIARSLRSTPNMYDQAAAAYKIMKSLGIYQSKQEIKLENDRQRAVNNTNKPRPLSSISPQQGDSPLSRANAFANGLTEDIKEQLRREMSQARKNM